MATPTTASPSSLVHSASGPTGVSTSAGTRLSVRRLNVMRIGYAVMGLGLAVTKWPMLIGRSDAWPLWEGISTYLLVAMGLLALLGLRYPVKMLPIMLFESLWKLMWLAVVAVPLWMRDGMDPATSEVAGAILWVVIVIAVTPWRYVVSEYLTRPGDAWRSPTLAR